MNFLDSKGDAQTGRVVNRLQFVGIAKFSDNIRFSLDGEAFKQWMQSHMNQEDKDLTFRVRAQLLEINSGAKEDKEIFLSFRGFFKQSVEGKVVLPRDIRPRDFDMFVRTKPYVLSFYYDEMVTV